MVRASSRLRLLVFAPALVAGMVAIVALAVLVPALSGDPARTWQWLLEALAASLLAGSAVALVAAWWMRRRLLEPFLDLVRASERLAGTELGHRVPEPELEELSLLARSLNRLAERVEEQMRTTERERRRLEEILSGMSEGILVTDARGRPVYANRSFRRLFGVAERVPPEHLPPSIRRPELDELLRGALQGGNGSERELRFGNRVLTLSATRLDAPEEGVLLLVRDRTEAARAALVRRDFVANVSHELKTPLAVVRGAAETLQGLAETDAEGLLGRFTGRILEQVQRLEELLRDLLVLSRLESPEASAPRTPVDLAEVVESALETMAPVAEGRQVALRREVETVPPVEGDRRALERLLLNLLDNAIKYGRDGGTVTVRSRRSGDEALLEVADQGPGVPAAEHARIFERFYRVDKGRGRREGGSGLGLSIVKHVAQAHGGSVEVDSESGRGACFRVRLPILQGSPE